VEDRPAVAEKVNRHKIPFPLKPMFDDPKRIEIACHVFHARFPFRLIPAGERSGFDVVAHIDHEKPLLACRGLVKDRCMAGFLVFHLSAVKACHSLPRPLFAIAET